MTITTKQYIAIIVIIILITLIFFPEIIGSILGENFRTRYNRHPFWRWRYNYNYYDYPYYTNYLYYPPYPYYYQPCMQTVDGTILCDKRRL